ncbi:SMC family ATPase [uncultured Methanobrevibacter sp.]|uniref:AAA family ATPase n=1 Tax=uncultured Methanobrevibacter sp. TaxID=253161 RepID=UPI0025FDC34B|nr:SMC family ATPase [uncultured Methanobrevibacter sp.]
MIIEKLELKNFKSYLNTKIQFNPGITLIIGENGAGKSTILEAISFALFKQHSSNKISDLIRTSNDKTILNNMEVTLEFISNGNHYKVTRSKEKSISHAKLYYKQLNHDKSNYVNTMICEGDRSVNNEIENILQMDADLFLNAIYVRQGEIAELISKTPSEKKKLIGKLLGIDSLEKSWTNIKKFISDYEKLESEYRGKLSRKDENTKELKDKQSKYDNLSTELIKIQEELNQIEILYKDINTKKLSLEANKDEYINYKNMIETSLNDIERLKQEKSELQTQLDDIRKNESEVLRLGKYLDRLPIYKEFRQAYLKIMDITQKKEELNKQKESFIYQNNILKENEQIYNDYNRLETIINDLKEEKSKMNSEIKVYEKITKDLEIVEEEYKKENEKFNKFQSELFNSLKENNISLKNDNEDLGQISELIIKRIEELEEKIIGIDELISKKSSKDSQYHQIISQSENILEELESVGDKCPICQSTISNMKKIDLKNSYKNAIINSTNNIKKNKEDIEKLESEKSEIKEKINNLSLIEKNISSNSYLIERIVELKKKLETLEKESNSNKVNNVDLDKINENIQIETDRRNLSKEGYNKYIKAKGAIELLPPLNQIENKIKLLNDDQDHEVNIIKLAMSKDSGLNSDMELEDINSKIQDLEDKVANYRELKGTIQVKESVESKLENKKKTLSENEKNLLKYKEAIKSIKYDDEKYNALVLQLASIEDNRLKINNDKSRLEGESKTIEESIESLQKLEDEYNTLEEDYKNVKDYIQFLENIRELFSKDGLQEDLRKLSRPTIQKYTKDFFEEFNFDYSSLILDDEFNVTLYGPEGESSLNMVSGGEKIAIALALRLGITKAMSNGAMETILLDEPTIHLDSYRRGELIDLLRKMSTLPQMIIVTHDEELENAADNIIKVVKKQGNSEISTDDIN